MIDIVYVLGSGSTWQNNELRYSLRSIHLFAKRYRNIYIIGEDPGFINTTANDIRLLPFPDKSAYNKEKNIFEKICHACEQEALSDRFLFINDDHFFVADTDISSYPNYHRGQLYDAYRTLPAGGAYRRSLKNTDLALKAKGLSTFHFDAHCPIIYRKKNFLNLRTSYDWSVSFGFAIKSLYANTLAVPWIFREDLKFNSDVSADEIAVRIFGREVFSIRDHALKPPMKAFLEQLFPNPSPWEK